MERFTPNDPNARRCGRCGRLHSRRHSYCGPCHADYMREWRKWRMRKPVPLTHSLNPTHVPE